MQAGWRMHTQKYGSEPAESIGSQPISRLHYTTAPHCLRFTVGSFMVPPHTLQQKPEVAFKPKQLMTTAAILTVREKKHKAHNRA